MRVMTAVAMGLVLAVTVSATAGDWMQFRGPGGLGISDEKNTPVKWGTGENIAWQVDLPGPGASSPIVVGDRVFVTCYTGYGLAPNDSELAPETSPEMTALSKFFRDEGLYTFVRWHNFFTNPPLTIKEAELREGFGIIDRGLETVDRSIG